MPGARRTRWARVLLVVCLVVIALAAVLVAQRRSVARALIDAQLRNLGLEEIGHEVERFGLNEFGLRNFHVGSGDGPDLAIDRLYARYSVSSLLAGRLEKLDIRGVRIQGSVDDDGRISFGALDTLLANKPSEAAAPSPAPVALVARDVEIDAVELELKTPEGPITGRFDARITESAGRLRGAGTASGLHPAFKGTVAFGFEGAPDAYTGTARFEVQARAAPDTPQADPAEFVLSAKLSGSRERVDIAVEPIPFRYRAEEPATTLRASGESPALTLSLPLPVGSAAIEIASTAVGGRMLLPGLDLELTGFSVAAEVVADTLRPAGRFRVERVADRRSPERFAAGALSGRVAFGDSGIDFDAQLQPADGAFDIRLRGTHVIETAAGHVELELAPIAFAAGGLQPAAVFPALGANLTAVTGSIAADGSAHWSADAPLRSQADVIARGLSFTSEFARFERLDTAIHIEGPTPAWHTPPGQLLSMASVDFGLELTNGLVALRWLGGGRVDIASAKFSLAGGTVHTHGSIDLDSPRQAVVLELRDLELAKLLELADLDGLTGSGRLTGTVPLVRSESTVEIRAGKLAGAGDRGWIKYQSGVAGVEREGFGVVLEALENFQYDAIDATLDGDTAGPVNVSIRLQGKNPEYLDGHPIDFTLNVESHLVDLLQKASAVYRIPDEIQKRIEALSGASD